MVVQFWFLNSRLGVGRLEGLETIMRTAGSLWLASLSVRSCRRSRKLLNEIGLHPREHGWDLLCHNSVVYWVVQFFPDYTPLGPLIYVGETDHMQRRTHEHVIRICATQGNTQQPFFDFVRGPDTCPQKIKASLCEWLFIPTLLVPNELRKCTERSVIQRIGTLNPSRVYFLLHRQRAFKRPGVALFERNRPLKRLRRAQQQSDLEADQCRKARKSWTSDLQQIAAAISGHNFPGSNVCANKAWRLEPGQWVYVANRVQNCEEGWRRRRGLEMLRRISKVRPNLPPPISIIHCRIPWVGSNKGMEIVISSIKKILHRWRKMVRGYPSSVMPESVFIGLVRLH